KFDFNTALTAATTLYAGWKQNEVENPVAKVTVAFHAGEGLFEDGTDTYEIEVDENTVLDEDEIPRPEKTGYEFDWWYTDEDLTEEWDADEPITADLDLYAYYEVAERVIEFDVNKGTFPNVVNSTNITKLSGEKISQDDLIIAPTKYGYDFIGWCKDAEGKDLWDYDNDVVTDNMTLYAGWVKHDYGESPKFEGIQGKGLSYNGIYKGVIDGENVEFVCTKMKYADNDSNSDSTPEVLTYGSIVWEGHYIEIKSIGTSATIAIIDGVEVRITSPVYGRLKIEREGYADITLKTDDATGGLPMG
ncbi:MAG: InlB B-repeat-containing protein, partial [Clostridiales bacterium]|nr:InlB B-repeat-containing protein [Clostridiales bacterium]